MHIECLSSTIRQDIQVCSLAPRGMRLKVQMSWNDWILITFKRYTEASAVVLSDFFPQTMENLRHNIERNRSSGTIGRYPERCAADKCTAHAVDWADTTAWTAGGPDTAPAFDIVIGADLVYHDDVIAMFISTLQHVLREGGRFLYVSRERRGGMALLGPALEMAGFTLQKREEAPAAYRKNPMPSTTQVCLFFKFNFFGPSV